MTYDAVSDRLIVFLEDRVAGVLSRLSGGRLRFDYADDYRESADATPLSLSMPVQIHSHAHQVVDPWLWNLLPDNDNVLQRWGREYHTSASSSFALLATPIGKDCAGAVRFVPEDDADRALSRGGDVIWLTDDEVGARLGDLRDDSTAWHGRTFTGQFSLAGAQAKTALLNRDGRWGVPTGALATTHILKPAVVGLDEHDLNEHLCLEAARHAGLVVARSKITRFGDEMAIVLERYDRRRNADGVVRIHQEDLCQALGVHPSRKYQNQGGPTPAAIVSLFRAAMPAEAAEDAIWRFVDALIWNWLIAGTDAHAKNYSLLLAGTEVRLAPLYDIASILPYGFHERALNFAMKIGGDYRVFPHRNTWLRAAVELKVNPHRVQERARELADRVAPAFADATSSPEVRELGRTMPARLVDLVAGRAVRCRSLLD